MLCKYYRSVKWSNENTLNLDSRIYLAQTSIFQIIDDVAVGVVRTASVASKAVGGAAIGLSELDFHSLLKSY